MILCPECGEQLSHDDECWYCFGCGSEFEADEPLLLDDEGMDDSFPYDDEYSDSDDTR
jgi:hypothetical protein